MTSFAARGRLARGSLAIAATLFLACSPSDDSSAAEGGARASISPGTGTYGGFYYVFWTDGQGAVDMSLAPAGGYTVAWTNCGNFLAGEGWNPGSRRKVNYSAAFHATGGAYLALYGWTTNPLVEYYVVESWGADRPAPGTYRGAVTTDGATYDLYERQMVNQPSIEGVRTFKQYWSVRRSRREGGGTLTAPNHFDAWALRGMNLGAFNYMVLLTEGYQGTGRSEVALLDPPTTWYALDVTRAGAGAGTVTAAGGAIDCGTTCSAQYPGGTAVTLTAAASGTSTFGGWGGACSGTAAICVVTMGGDRSVTATFDAAAVPPSTITTSETGTQGGFFYSFWTDGIGSTSMTLGPAGSYSTSFTNCGDFIAGKGWRPASAATTVSYSGTLDTAGNAYVSLYGWMTGTSPQIEFYVVDSWGSWRPPGGQAKGTVTTDGGTYDIFQTQWSSGINPVRIYWSVRQTKRVGGGTITAANHFDAWARLGMTLGTVDYMILATEGYQSSGSSSITVGPGTDTPATPCANPVTFTRSTGNFDTTGAVCYRTSAAVNGWGCANLTGRTVSVNGGTATSTCGAGPFPLGKSADGYTYFSVTAGAYPWASIYTW